MPNPPKFPASADEALAAGYQPVAQPDKIFADRDAMSRDFSADAPAFAECKVSPAGSKCFELRYPNGTIIVGFCDGNGMCKLYEKGP